MAGQTKKSGSVFEPKKSGGAATTTMVMFAAKIGISGPGYRVEGGESAPIPTKYAKVHVKDGHGEIVGEELKGND